LCSIQVLLKEQIVLLKVANSSGGTSLLRAIDSTRVMGPSPTSSVQPTPGDSHTPDLSLVPSASESPGGMSESDHRCPWMPKMDFRCFDGTDVTVWLDKCFAYFHLYGIPSNFRVTVAALHMVDKAAY
jgi:hypothetical protein